MVNKMTISEIFQHPTVKQVIFQIKFPNLFYLENKIGEYQLKIMKDFPQSALLNRRHIVLANLGPEENLQDIKKDIQADGEGGLGSKIWQFTSEKGVKLNVLSNALDLTSVYHKTYNLEGAEKFRDAIQSAVNHFFTLVQIPIISRIGLRYVDECPVPSKTNKSFLSHYNTTFPLNRFDIRKADNMQFMTVVKMEKYNLRYVETLVKDEDKYKLVLDFDAFAINIDPNDYLSVTDYLHEIISNEYEKTIKEPIYKLMRKK